MPTRGRKRGSVRVAEPDLSEALQGESVESCRWSRRRGTSFRSLCGSKRRVHAGIVAKLGGKLSYRTLLRRLAGGKMGFSKKSRKVDVCQACRVWDCHISLQLEATLSLTEKKTTQASCELFWTGDHVHKKFVPPSLEDGM